MLREELKRLMDLFSEGAEGKPIHLEEVFKEAFAFFGKLNDLLKEGDQEEKKEALSMMNELYTHMTKESKRMCEKTGMTEQQLAKYAENPSNFSPQQWGAIQEAREKMTQAGTHLAKSIEELLPDEQRAALRSQPLKKKEKTEKPGGVPKKSKKSKWLKS
ncbi:MAG: hypothetical protein HYZ48_01870 [Chlamydiales bacterium]|nr:hypothetical protein [Chlamydiales bacterium]